MVLNIRNAEADRLARELARRKGKPLTEVVIEALRADLERERKRVRSPGLAQRLLEIGERYSRLPVIDSRSEDEILGYDEMMRGD